MECSSPSSPVPDNVPTPRRRITEKKRRLVTNSFFDELVVVLSLIKGPECENPRKLDKVSILQQTRNLVKFFHDLSVHQQELDGNKVIHGDISKTLPFLKTGAVFELLLDTLNGFVLVVMSSGRIVHASNNTICTLGCRPSIVIGQHASSWMHQEDAVKVLRPKTPPSNPGMTATIGYPVTSFQCRFKLQGTYDVSVNGALPSSQLAPYNCSIYSRECSLEDQDVEDIADPPPCKKKGDHCVVVVASSKSLAYSDAPIQSDESEFCFELRITQEGTILSISSHSALVLGFTEAEIIGSSIFEYVYPYHVTAFGQSISVFLQNGYGATNPYRILTKGGQWVWCVTRGFIGCNPWSNEPDHILLHMRVIGTDHINPQQRDWTNFTYLPEMKATPKSEVQNETPQSTPSQVIPTRIPSTPIATPHIPSSPMAVPQIPSSPIAIPPIPSTPMAVPQIPSSPIGTPRIPSSSISADQIPPTQMPTPQVAPAQIGPPQVTLNKVSMAQATPTQTTPPPATPTPPSKPPSSVVVVNQGSSLSSTSLNEEKMAERVKMLEKELSSKNAELFESQKRLLEQQNLLGQERKRFFELTETLVRQYNVFQDYQFQSSKYPYSQPPQKWPTQYPPGSNAAQPFTSSEMSTYPPTTSYCPSSGMVRQEPYYGHEMSPESKDHSTSDPVASILSKLLPDMQSNTFSSTYTDPSSTDNSAASMPYSAMPRNNVLPF